MNATSYTFGRNMRNELKAKSAIPLGIERRELRIETQKRSRGLSAHASVVQVSADGLSFTWAPFSDFSESVEADPSARCTEKAIRAMHERALAKLPALIARAAKHYAPSEHYERRGTSIYTEDKGPGTAREALRLDSVEAAASVLVFMLPAASLVILRAGMAASAARHVGDPAYAPIVESPAHATARGADELRAILGA